MNRNMAGTISGIVCMVLGWGVAAGQETPSGIIQSVVVDPYDMQSVFATGANTIYRSIDGGASWTGTPVSTEPWSVAITPYDPAGDPGSMPAYIAGTQSRGVLQSTNGIDWTVSQGIGGNVHTVYVHPVTGEAFAGSGAGLYKSTDKGANWSLVSGELNGGGLHGIVADASNPLIMYAAQWNHGIHSSIDGGISWQTGINGLTSLEINGLALRPDNASILFVATNSGVFRSVDAGASWIMVHPITSARAVAIDPQAPGMMIVASAGNGVARSTDGGETWSAVTAGLDGRTHFESVAFSADGSGRAFAGSWNSVLYFSDDGGITWSTTPGSNPTGTPVPTTPPPLSPPPVGPTTLSIQIIDRNNNQVQLGEPANFDVIVKNTGTDTAVNANVRLSWTQPNPNGTAYGVNGSWSGGQCDSNNECHLGDIPASGQITISVSGFTPSTWVDDYRLLATAGADNATDVTQQRDVDVVRTVLTVETGGGGSMGVFLLLCLGSIYRFGNRALPATSSPIPVASVSRWSKG